MKNIIKIIAIGGMLFTSAFAIAQNTNSAYFLENYNYRYQLNPVFGNDMGYVSFPALGNINLAMRGNLHVEDLIHSVNGKTVLFTNPEVPVSFLNDLPSRGKMGLDLHLNIMSAGWKAWGGYNAITIGARVNADLSFPKSVFTLIKEGVSNKTYDISDMSATANAYTEIALNHSRDIKPVPGLRAGIAMKFLVGIANIDARFNRANLSLGTNEWIARTNADIYANLGGLRYKTKINDNGESYVDGFDMKGEGSVGPNGFGMAFDLGASYKWRDFNFSVGILDLGWISYWDTQYATTNGDKIINTDAYVFNADDTADNSFEKEWDRMSGDLDKLYQLENHGNIGTRNCGLGTTLNIGVDYEFPFYRKLHFGFLSSTRILDRYTWSEVRVSANVMPVKCFSASANFAVGTYGAAFGWLVNFNTRGFNIFLGMDNTLGRLSKQYVPLNSNAAVNLGINFPF